jgi:phosphoribosyl-dephospho-CoA transferase
MLCRHNRIWLTAQGWKRACATVPDRHTASLASWAEKCWPAIVRRSEPGTAPGTICLGLPLPPHAQAGLKIRIPISVHAEDIARHAPPLSVAEAVAAMPPAWQDAFAELSRDAASRQLRFHVYGSTAMQAITGLPYLHAASDIDLLFYPLAKAQLQEGIALLAMYAKRLPLDGEIVFPSGRSAAWKEWAQAIDNPAGTRVMTKSIHAVSLASIADLHSEFGNPS